MAHSQDPLYVLGSAPAVDPVQNSINSVRNDDSLEALQSGIEAIEAIENSLKRTEDDVGYKGFLYERQVKMGLSTDHRTKNRIDYRTKYRIYLGRLFQMMAAFEAPWIESWLGNRIQSIEGVAGDLPDMGDSEQPEWVQDDSIAFGKIATVMEFIYDEKEPSKLAQKPTRIRIPAKELLGGDSVLRGSSKTPSIRWYHLPANNMAWVEHCTDRRLHTIANPRSKSDHSHTILKPQFWSGRQSSDIVRRHHYTRFMRPTCLRLPADPMKETPARDKNNMVFFMPYLHYETDIACLKQHYIVEHVHYQSDEGDLFTEEELRKLECDIDEKIIRKYLNSPKPLHLRRTLDQSYYYTLEDTLRRDRDQVVSRYVKKELQVGDVSPPVLMVDQCWLWILGDNVVTCFPGCWREDGGSNPRDPLDVLERIVRNLHDKQTYSTICSPLDLANFIMESCASNIMDFTNLENREDYSSLHFLEWFSRSIKAVMAKQTELFEQFCRDPEKIQQLLQFITIADRDLKRFDTPLPGEYSYWQKALADLQKPIGDGLFDINGEITTLQEIKDIRDELRMIEDVLRQQIKSVEMMYNVLERRQIYRADEMLQNIQGRIDIIKQLQQDARQAYDGILHLLDLKQKQANVEEARSATRQAEQATRQAEEAAKQAAETTRQGTSIMLFTTVTIIFLPLSSIASIFGLNAKELNNGNIGIGVVFAYLFPISVFVVLFAFLLAFHNGARVLFTLSVQLALEHTDRLTGFSRLFDEHKVKSWEAKLEKMQKEKAKRLEERALGLGTISEKDMINEENTSADNNTIDEKNTPSAQPEIVSEGHTSSSIPESGGRKHNTLWRRAINKIRSPLPSRAADEPA